MQFTRKMNKIKMQMANIHFTLNVYNVMNAGRGSEWNVNYKHFKWRIWIVKWRKKTAGRSHHYQFKSPSTHLLYCLCWPSKCDIFTCCLCWCWCLPHCLSLWLIFTVSGCHCLYCFYYWQTGPTKRKIEKERETDKERSLHLQNLIASLNSPQYA